MTAIAHSTVAATACAYTGSLRQQTCSEESSSTGKLAEDEASLKRKEDAAAAHKASSDDSEDVLELSEADLRIIQELNARDREVRTHEQAHLAAAGAFAQGGPSFTYQVGPDGKRYAIGGEVSIDTSAAANPQASIQKARQIRQAALAPAEPSTQDRKVAAQATAMERQARVELAEQGREQLNESKSERDEQSASSASVQTPAAGADHAAADPVNANTRRLQQSFDTVDTTRNLGTRLNQFA